MKRLLAVVMLSVAAWLGFKEYQASHLPKAEQPGKVEVRPETQRTESNLPSSEVRGYESSSFSLYVSSGDGATTGIGQIFSPPEGHNLLFNVGFYCRQYLASGLINRGASDFYITLRISPWEGGHPSPDTLWKSSPIPVQPDFDKGWISFDVPHIQLNENQAYIAWLTLSGFQNPDSRFGVVSMGPTTADPPPEPGKPWQPRKWTTAYPEGMRAFWRHNNPDGNADSMTQATWVVDGSGQNLHFKMVFENKER